MVLNKNKSYQICEMTQSTEYLKKIKEKMNNIPG